MALKFEVDPEYPRETLYNIADTCDALAALLQLQLSGISRETDAHIELDDSAMGGLSDIIKAMAVAAREIDDRLALQNTARSKQAA